MTFYTEIIQELKKSELNSSQWAKLKRDLSVKYKLKSIPTNIQVLLNADEKDIPEIKSKLITKPTRTISGVAPIAIMSKPFPCPHALNSVGPCTMCPGGPKSSFGDVPQSYTGKEPATMRGIRNQYDSYLQVFNRLEQYVILGHNFEKVELIIMGGTFPSYPIEYQDEFIKFAFKAMNDFSRMFYSNEEFDYLKFKEFFELPVETLGDEARTERIQRKLFELKGECELLKEQTNNESSKVKCVALCIETRPDYGLLKQGTQMLKLGCTRVELGIQSVYDSALDRIQRGHSTSDTKKSIQILKDLGFKVAGHYMPGLPGMNYDKDLEGMKQLFSNPDYCPDMLKLYPCMVTKGTKLYQEFQDGKFTPLTADQAAKLIADFKPFIPEYCRVMRIQRDIPTYQIAAGVEMTNLRQYLFQKFNPVCRCIRCREPKDKEINWNCVKINVKEYLASKGKEFFISVEDTKTDILIAFLRLRFPSECLREEITDKSSIVRELHVYGTSTNLKDEGNVQHRGWGKKLMQKAEDISLQHNKNKVVVISGVGVRKYYEKLGYSLEGPYMVKSIN
jgi:elongator complex protein 3